MTVRAGRAGSRTGAGAGGTAPTVLDPARIRNVVLVGPSGAGKTTLVEALLAHTGTIPRAGGIVDGTTVCDHDPAAVRQQRSVALSVAPLTCTGDTKINLIDTPGYGDFVGELRAGLRAADAALFVVPASAGREGAIDPATVTQWEECAAVGMPRAVVVSRCDHPRADVEATIAACQDAFGAGVAPLYLPLAGRRGDDRALRADHPDPGGRGAARRRRRPRHPARGDHRAVRGRDAHGALPRAARRSTPRS